MSLCLMSMSDYLVSMSICLHVSLSSSIWMSFQSSDIHTSNCHLVFPDVCIAHLSALVILKKHFCLHACLLYACPSACRDLCLKAPVLRGLYACLAIWLHFCLPEEIGIHLYSRPSASIYCSLISTCISLCLHFPLLAFPIAFISLHLHFPPSVWIAQIYCTVYLPACIYLYMLLRA